MNFTFKVVETLIAKDRPSYVARELCRVLLVYLDYTHLPNTAHIYDAYPNPAKSPEVISSPPYQSANY